MKNWIKGAIAHPGALHAALDVPMGKPIPAGKMATAAKAPGKMGQRARLAETLKGLHKGNPAKADSVSEGGQHPGFDKHKSIKY